jgi:thiamine-monophosphate kinase
MTAKRRRRPGEFELIARYFRPLAADPGAFGLTDDAALYRQRPGDDLVITADMIAEGVHFFPDDPPESVARKALRVNLSDLAAKGAVPFAYLLSLALPGNWTEAWVRSFARGLKGDQGRYDVSLLGGDTIRSAGGLAVAVTAIGRVAKGRMILRSGARPGDAVFVTGTIGDAALGLRVRRGNVKPPVGARRLLDRYLHPQPRLALAPVLSRHATSAVDVSDGLVADLAHICAASGVGAEIAWDAVPLSAAARRLVTADRSLIPAILNGGDDYEIVATVAGSAASGFLADAEKAGVAVTRIGRIVAGKGPPVVRDSAGRPVKLTVGGHTHF